MLSCLTINFLLDKIWRESDIVLTILTVYIFSTNVTIKKCLLTVLYYFFSCLTHDFYLNNQKVPNYNTLYRFHWQKSQLVKITIFIYFYASELFLSWQFLGISKIQGNNIVVPFA
jgi:hypothetical protein